VLKAIHRKLISFEVRYFNFHKQNCNFYPALAITVQNFKNNFFYQIKEILFLTFSFFVLFIAIKQWIQEVH
jgi:hypothetical protein